MGGPFSPSIYNAGYRGAPKGVFISPKVYGYVNENNKSVIKIKGFNDCSHITLDQLS